MGFFKEKMIEHLGHDLDDPWHFLKAQAVRAEKAATQAAWWKNEADDKTLKLFDERLPQADLSRAV